MPLLIAVTVGMTWLNPLLAAPLLVIASASAYRSRSRRSHHDLVAGFLRTIASELRAGRSLRAAVADAVDSLPELDLAAVGRTARAGRPLSEVAAALSEKEGMAVAATALRVGARTGGSIVSVFDALTAEAAEEADLERERRTLTVQARVSIVLVGGFPLVVVVTQVWSGEAARLVAMGPVGAVIMGVGSILLLAGLTAVGVMLRRVRR
jgi:Flp pilus assembly protein TadB